MANLWNPVCSLWSQGKGAQLRLCQQSPECRLRWTRRRPGKRRYAAKTSIPLLKWNLVVPAHPMMAAESSSRKTASCAHLAGETALPSSSRVSWAWEYSPPRPLSLISFRIRWGCWHFGSPAVASRSQARGPYGELATIWPSAGGEYVYLSRSYGPVAGFLSGWTSLVAGFSGTLAASSIALVVYAGHYLPGLSSDQPLVSLQALGLTLSLSSRSIAAALIIVCFAAVHIFSLRAGKIAQNFLSLLIVGTFAAFAPGGFAVGEGSWTHFQSLGVQLHPKSWLLALIPVMFTYSGWNAAAYLSEEIQGPRRTIRSVLTTGTWVVIVLYTVLNALYLYAMPPAQMRGASNVATEAARARFGPGRDFVTPVLILTLLGTISATTIAGPRVYFAMARDRAFIPIFGRRSGRFGTPALAIALQALWSSVLVMIIGFEQILMSTGFALVLSSGAAVAGLFLVRRRGGDFQRKSSIPLFSPAVFVFVSGVIVINTVLEAPRVALMGVLLIAAGLPIYVFCRMNRPADADTSSEPWLAEEG